MDWTNELGQKQWPVEAVLLELFLCDLGLTKNVEEAFDAGICVVTVERIN